MLPISMFVFPQLSGQLRALHSIARHTVRILENKNKVLAACGQVPDPQVQVQVPSTTSLVLLSSVRRRLSVCNGCIVTKR